MTKISEYPTKTIFKDEDLYDISTYDGVSAYDSEQATYSEIKDNLATRFFQRLGNAFGGNTIIGLTDAFDLIFRTNNVNRLRMYANGLIETTKGLNIGDKTTLALMNDSYIMCGERNTSVYSAGQNLILGTSIVVATYDIIDVQVKIKGVDGFWYKPQNDFHANSLYHLRLNDGGTSWSVRLDSAGTETNFNNSLVEIFIIYKEK